MANFQEYDFEFSYPTNSCDFGAMFVEMGHIQWNILGEHVQHISPNMMKQIRTVTFSSTKKLPVRVSKLNLS